MNLTLEILKNIILPIGIAYITIKLTHKHEEIRDKRKEKIL